jgi:WD40 repeat protein
VLLGECDPLSLIDEAEQSPFNVTQPVMLEDFSRTDLDLFATELNVSAEQASAALDRIFYWTRGQPYLAQKLARSISREKIVGDIIGNVDRIATTQLAGRAALHSEPHMSHIHRQVVKDDTRREPLLNLYGRIRKGITVPADLGSSLQRRLIAIGLIMIDEEGNLAVRNRLYGAVFTSRWANENLPTHLRTLATAAGVLLLILALPFWYTQLLPKSYVNILTSETVELDVARDAYVNMRSFPGHVEAADNLYRSFLQTRANASSDEAQIALIAQMTSELPDAGRLPEELLANFWDRRVHAATRVEHRDDALIASLESLVLSTPLRRNRSAMLVGDDYPLLLASVVDADRGNVVFNPESLLLTDTRAAEVTQWSLDPQGLQRRDGWTITALEVTPLVRRVIVDQQGEVNRIGLTINVSHARVNDLRIKVIAPSGRAVEVDPGVERASSNEDLRIPTSQLGDLVGEPLEGTWSLSVRDEELGVAGRLVGWNLQLNSQGLIEDFQRGLNIADPSERETDNLWFSADGRFAVARSMQSDSARVWDLAFAKPVRAVAVNELEQVIGLSGGARLLVTATQDKVNLWDTATGNRVATLPVGSVSASSVLTADGTHLFVQRRSDIDTTLELWSLEDASIDAQFDIAGTPALVSLDSSGNRIAVADYDRAVRVWDFHTGSLIVQLDLLAQPSEISLASGGEVLGVVFGELGASLWRLDQPNTPLLEEFGDGRWQVEFSPSGTKVLVGRSGRGFLAYDSADGRVLGPALGSGAVSDGTNLLAFSADEQTVVTDGAQNAVRFWRMPTLPARGDMGPADESVMIWPPSGDAVALATPGATAIVIGDRHGDVHIVSADASREELLSKAEDVSFFGHNAEVRHLALSPDGSLIASVGDDNSLRVWATADGLPRPFMGNISDGPIDRLAFSPDSKQLGILNGNNAEIIDTATGELLARFDLGEAHKSLAFADVTNMYVGSESGTLRVISRESGDRWSLRTLWQGEAAIRWLEASPRSQYLVLVDQNSLAQVFSLAEGRIGTEILQLPSAVEEVSFAPGGMRVLFRTSNWIHRASLSAVGLVWVDAMLAPKALQDTRMVFGNPAKDSAAAHGNRLYLPVAGDGYVRLAELSFTATHSTGLFGNKEQLLEEWRRKLAMVTTQRSDE